MNKKSTRLRRLICFRSKIKKINLTRLVVHRTSRHIYAQIILYDNYKILVTASSLEKNLVEKNKYTGNKKTAFLIGKIIAIRSLKLGIKNIFFDRSGFKYHGRIQVLADSARKFGLNF